MFWKIIRWGGTVVVILILIAAALMSHTEPTEGDEATPAAPTAEPAADQPSKKFNL